MNQKQKDDAMFDLIREMLREQSEKDLNVMEDKPGKRNLLKKVLRKLKRYFKKENGDAPGILSGRDEMIR